jgi:hypothetical protein
MGKLDLQLYDDHQKMMHDLFMAARVVGDLPLERMLETTAHLRIAGVYVVGGKSVVMSEADVDFQEALIRAAIEYRQANVATAQPGSVQ